MKDTMHCPGAYSADNRNLYRVHLRTIAIKKDIAIAEVSVDHGNESKPEAGTLATMRRR